MGSAEVTSGNASAMDSYRVVVNSADVDLWRWRHRSVQVLVREVFQRTKVQGKVCDSYSVVVHGADVDLWRWRHWSVVVLVYEVLQCAQVEGKVFKMVYFTLISNRICCIHRLTRISVLACARVGSHFKFVKNYYK